MLHTDLSSRTGTVDPVTPLNHNVGSEACSNETPKGIILGKVEVIKNSPYVPWGTYFIDAPTNGSHLQGTACAPGMSCIQPHDHLWPAEFAYITADKFHLNMCTQPHYHMWPAEFASSTANKFHLNDHHVCTTKLCHSKTLHFVPQYILVFYESHNKQQ